MKRLLFMMLSAAVLSIISCDQDDDISSESSILQSNSGFQVIFDTNTSHFDNVGTGSIGPVGDYFAAIDFTLLPDNKSMHITTNASKNGAFGEYNSMIERWAVNVNTQELLEPNPNDLSDYNQLFLFPKRSEAYGSRFGMVRGTSGFFLSAYPTNNISSLSGDFSYSRTAIGASQASVAWNGEFVEDGYAAWTSNTFHNHRNDLGFHYQRQDGTGHTFEYKRIEYEQYTVIRSLKIIPSAINGNMIYMVGLSDSKLYLAKIPLTDELPATNQLIFSDSLDFESSTNVGGEIYVRMSDDEQNLLILTTHGTEDARTPSIHTILYNLASGEFSINVKNFGIQDFKPHIPKWDMDDEGNLYYPGYDGDFSYELDKTNNFSIYKISGDSYTTVGKDGLMSDPPTGYPNTREVSMVRVLNGKVYASVEYVDRMSDFEIERRLAIISN